MDHKEFQKRLNRLDWTYMMSDDRLAYQRGAEEFDTLYRIARENGWFPEFRAARDRAIKPTSTNIN